MACKKARDLLSQYKMFQLGVFSNGRGLMWDILVSVTENREQVKKVARMLYDNKLHKDVWMFSTKLTQQFEKYGDNFSIERNLNCAEVAEAYYEYKEPLCSGVRSGFIELVAAGLLSLPL